MVGLLKIIPLLVGWLLDLLLGDPVRLPHPVVYMGKWISFWEKRLNHDAWRRTKGALLAVSSIGLTFMLFWGLLRVLDLLPFGEYISMVVCIVCIFFCLAGKTLRREVKMVFVEADKGEEEARRQVARIVGRDTSELTLQECRIAALETLAENLSDGVIAPLFWLALLGVPGMMAYKMVNTLDSMIGYHSERYLRFGTWAARIDDVANYIPARLTALLMLAVEALRHPTHFLHNCRFVLKYGPQHASPNSGWPEAALAAILNCRFGGPHHYFGEYFYKPYIGEHERMVDTADMRCSLRICLMAEVFMFVVVTLIVGCVCLPFV